MICLARHWFLGCLCFSFSFHPPTVQPLCHNQRLMIFQVHKLFEDSSPLPSCASLMTVRAPKQTALHAPNPARSPATRALNGIGLSDTKYHTTIRRGTHGSGNMAGALGQRKRRNIGSVGSAIWGAYGGLPHEAISSVPTKLQLPPSNTSTNNIGLAVMGPLRLPIRRAGNGQPIRFLRTATMRRL